MKYKFIRGMGLLLALAAAPLGFSQSSGGTGSGSSSSSTGTGTATAESITNNSGGAMQVQALPGVTGNPGVFPGLPEQNGSWSPYFNYLFAVIPTAEMEIGRGKHDKVKGITLVAPADLPAENDNPIQLINWSPFGLLHYKDDRAIYTGITDGKVGEAIEETLLAAEYDAKKQSHTDRCVAFVRTMNEGVTNGFSVGTGGAGGMTPGPGTNNDNIAFAGGGLLGRNTTKESNYYELRLVCLNKGKFDAPPPPDKQEGSKDEGAATPPLPPTPPPAPPSPAPTPVAPAPTPAPTIAVDPCSSIPPLTIEFQFDHPRRGETWTPSAEDREEIAQMGTWLKDPAHSVCKVQVQGHASEEASNDYNMMLGDRRSKPVYDLLIELGVPPSQIEHASLGKYFPKGDYLPANRRVILVVQGPASGK